MKNKRYSLLVTLLFLVMLLQAQVPAYLQGAEVQAYTTNAADIKKAIKLAVGDEMGALILQHKLKGNEVNEVRNLVEQRETRKATYNYVYANDDTTRYKIKQAVDAQFRESMVRTLVTLGKTLGDNNCCLIMQNKDSLQLTPAQQVKIVDWSVKVDSILAVDPKMELRTLEFPVLKSILTPKQFDQFVSFKLNGEVVYWVKKTWKTLTDNGIEYGMDSTATAVELYHYHMAYAKALYLNFDNNDARWSSITAIVDAAPLAIKRANSVSEAIEAKNAYKGTLTW